MDEKGRLCLYGGAFCFFRIELKEREYTFSTQKTLLLANQLLMDA
jgi:hypothetical protein